MSAQIRISKEKQECLELITKLISNPDTFRFDFNSELALELYSLTLNLEIPVFYAIRKRMEATGELSLKLLEALVADAKRDCIDSKALIYEIQAALAADDRRRAVDVRCEYAKRLRLDGTHAEIYKAASQDKSEFYKWLRHDIKQGRTADLNIREALLDPHPKITLND